MVIVIESSSTENVLNVYMFTIYDNYDTYVVQFYEVLSFNTRSRAFINKTMQHLC